MNECQLAVALEREALAEDARLLSEPRHEAADSLCESSGRTTSHSYSSLDSGVSEGYASRPQVRRDVRNAETHGQ